MVRGGWETERVSKVGWGGKSGGAYSDEILVRGADQRGDVWAIWRLVFVV